MLINRREWLTAAAALALSSADTAHARTRSPPKAICFDGFPIIDARPVAARTETFFPGRGESLLAAWRTRQFEYTWLRTLGGRYVDFWHTTEDALVAAVRSLGLTMSPDARDTLMHTYLELKAWPDVLPALRKFHDAGIRTVFLSNFTAQMLSAAVENSGLREFFEDHLSTDRVHAYKPDPRAYAMALEAFQAKPSDIVFCAAAPWDVAGAKWYGYRTFWMNRSHQSAEELGVQPDGIGAGMADFATFVLGE
jgi:2-haloacid dehalogenase